MITVSKDTAVALLRISFLVGAITDGLAFIAMAFPGIGVAVFGGNPSRLSAEYRFALGIAASLMAGWTALLAWGAIDPMGRRDILVLTLVPVVAGIVAATVAAVGSRVVLFSRVLPLWIHLGCVTVLFLVSYALSFRVSG